MTSASVGIAFICYHVAMKDFFHGWRRKAGVVTLVMACFVTTGWVRSIDGYDFFALTGNPWVHIVLQSARGTVDLSLNSLNSPPLDWWWHGKLPRDAEPSEPSEPMEGCDIEWRWDWGGFTTVSYSVKYGAEILRTGSFIFPYWSVVIPLTLLSAYLLLWTPRKQPSPRCGGRDP